jgi:hypothetical protein
MSDFLILIDNSIGSSLLTNLYLMLLIIKIGKLEKQ